MDSSGSQPAAGGSGPVQLTLDLWGLSRDVAQVVSKVVISYAEDNLHPISHFPLQNFGAFIAIDKKRITDGQEALTKTLSKALDILKVVVGLSDRGIASEVAKDQRVSVCNRLFNSV